MNKYNYYFTFNNKVIYITSKNNWFLDKTALKNDILAKIEKINTSDTQAEKQKDYLIAMYWGFKLTRSKKQYKINDTLVRDYKDFY